MSSSIDNLKTAIGEGGGLAKPNRFSVDIPPLFGFGDNQYLSLMCESTAMPGKQITTFEYPYQLSKNEIKSPNGYFNEDVNFMFLLTNNYYVKDFFETWMDAIIPKKEYLLSYPVTYEHDIVVHQLDEQDRKVYSVKLIGAFPISVNTIELSTGASGDIGRLPVTFTYVDYEKQ